MKSNLPALRKKFICSFRVPDSKPWGITRFFNGVNEYAHEHHWLLTSCPVNPKTEVGERGPLLACCGWRPAKYFVQPFCPPQTVRKTL